MDTPTHTASETEYPVYIARRETGTGRSILIDLEKGSFPPLLRRIWGFHFDEVVAFYVIEYSGNPEAPYEPTDEDKAEATVD